MWGAALLALIAMAADGQGAPAAPAPPVPAATSTPAPPVPAANAATGTLVGRAPLPKVRPLKPTKDHYGSKVTSRIDPPDAPVSAVVMQGTFAPAPPGSLPVARMSQRNYQFKPATLVIRTGTSVVFPNQDDMYHNVFSLSPARKFDLGKYRKGEEPEPVLFDKPGVVNLYCEVHEHMRGAIVVVDSPHFTLTDAEGRFRLEGLPPGEHVFQVVMPPKDAVEFRARVEAGRETTVDWTVPAP